MTEVILARVGRIIELSEDRQLISAAEHDRLTQLYNKNFFFEYAKRLYQYHPELHFDAAAINIEQFHSINALHGRDFGDEVLRVLGDAIRSFLAETEGIASRIEGDRFFIYCMHQPDYRAVIDRLIKLIEENGLSYNNLKLEVTESAYTDNAKHVLEVIQRLRELGFEIEMDDFGSGYSSLNMLSDMPVDVLKMDMKFIRNIETSETDRRLVELVLDIAEYLKVAVVAEGVETEGQLAILRERK